MKDEFSEYYPLTKGELEDLWSRSVIVLDTNVILRLYRLSQKSVGEILELLNTMKDRIWIPYQVSLEYNRNRLEKIKESEGAYKTITEIVNSFIVKCDEKIREYSGYGIHPVIDMENNISEILEFAKKRMEIINKEHSDRSTSDHYHALHEKIGEIFRGRIGSDFSIDDLDALILRAKANLDKGVGPGSADYQDKRQKKLSDRECCGDFIIWESIIAESKARGCPVIFVTEDTKSDWWLRKDGKTVGPLPELRKEFRIRAGCTVYFYRFQQFLELSREHFGRNISDATVEDVKDKIVDELERIIDRKSADQSIIDSARNALDREVLLRSITERERDALDLDNIRISAAEFEKARQAGLSFEQMRRASVDFEVYRRIAQEAEIRRIQFEENTLRSERRRLEIAIDELSRKIHLLDTREIREGNDQRAFEISKLMEEYDRVQRDIRSIDERLIRSESTRRSMQ